MTTVTTNDIFYAALTAMLPLVLRYAYQIVSVKVADTNYNAAVDAVWKAVEYVNQTYVDALKAEGRFDVAAQNQAMEKAKDAALDIMDRATRVWLQKHIVDPDSWLTIQAENAVKGVKEA